MTKNCLFVKLKCKHIFHKECLQNWIGHYNKGIIVNINNFECPICRKLIYKSLKEEDDNNVPSQEETEEFVNFVYKRIFKTYWKDGQTSNIQRSGRSNQGEIETFDMSYYVQPPRNDVN